jgi:hypothetical protein
MKKRMQTLMNKTAEEKEEEEENTHTQLTLDTHNNKRGNI